MLLGKLDNICMKESLIPFIDDKSSRSSKIIDNSYQYHKNIFKPFMLVESAILSPQPSEQKRIFPAADQPNKKAML